jgi:hypothetical protein
MKPATKAKPVKTGPAKLAAYHAQQLAAPAVTANGKVIQPSRVGRVMIGGHFLPAVQKELKILAVRESTTLGQLLQEAISDLLAKRGLPTVEELERAAGAGQN